MWLQRLRVDGVRNLRQVDMCPGAGLNLILGDNGAGKTSLLEAVHCLGHGRSFRGSGRADYLNRTTKQALLAAELKVARGQHTIGLARSKADWQGRIDGQVVERLSELARLLPVLTFHPGLHELVEGAPEERRKFVDFGVFHVEHVFHAQWRAYRRALAQRNSNLRQQSSATETAAWNGQMAHAGELISAARQAYLEHFAPSFGAALAALDPELEPITLSLSRGWPDHLSLEQWLQQSYLADLEAGYTRQGPHRADLKLSDQQGRVAGRLSRGQQKLVALAMVLAQAQVLARKHATAAIIALDDLSSELDTVRQQRALHWLERIEVQVLITGTQKPEGWDRLEQQGCLFHVEQGKVAQVL